MILKTTPTPLNVQICHIIRCKFAYLQSLLKSCPVPWNPPWTRHQDHNNWLLILVHFSCFLSFNFPWHFLSLFLDPTLIFSLTEYQLANTDLHNLLPVVDSLFLCSIHFLCYLVHFSCFFLALASALPFFFLNPTLIFFLLSEYQPSC